MTTTIAAEKSQMNVWLCEDCPATAKAISQIVSEAEHSCSVFSTGEKLLGHLNRTKETPHVVLVDVRLPGMSGLELIGQLREQLNGAPCLLISQYENPAFVKAAVTEGAAGYLLKTNLVPTLKHALAKFRSGLVWNPIDPAVCGALMEQQDRSEVPIRLDEITEREHEVLALLAEGVVMKEIADTLGITRHGVDSHMRRIYAKLEVNNQAGAVGKALRLGVI